MVNYLSMSCKKQNDIILKINFTGFIYIRPPSIQNRTKLKYHKMSSNERFIRSSKLKLKFQQVSNNLIPIVHTADSIDFLVYEFN